MPSTIAASHSAAMSIMHWDWHWW